MFTLKVGSVVCLCSMQAENGGQRDLFLSVCFYPNSPLFKYILASMPFSEAFLVSLFGLGKV